MTNRKARILRRGLLGRISKRISAASREFSIYEGFALIFNKGDVNIDDFNFDPWNNRSLQIDKNGVGTFNSLTGDHTLPVKKVFSAELEIVNEHNVYYYPAGSVLLGDKFVTINCEEMEYRKITPVMLRNALGILVINSTSLSALGQTLKATRVFYKIEKIIPLMLQSIVTDYKMKLGGVENLADTFEEDVPSHSINYIEEEDQMYSGYLRNIGRFNTVTVGVDERARIMHTHKIIGQESVNLELSNFSIVNALPDLDNTDDATPGTVAVGSSTKIRIAKFTYGDAVVEGDYFDFTIPSNATNAESLNVTLPVENGDTIYVYPVPDENHYGHHEVVYQFVTKKMA